MAKRTLKIKLRILRWGKCPKLSRWPSAIPCICVRRQEGQSWRGDAAIGAGVRMMCFKDGGSVLEPKNADGL